MTKAWNEKEDIMRKKTTTEVMRLSRVDIREVYIDIDFKSSFVLGNANIRQTSVRCQLHFRHQGAAAVNKTGKIPVFLQFMFWFVERKMEK